MRYRPASGHLLECYEVGDSDLLGIANEAGDITAYVIRRDGTRGHSYGGPVYDPPEFCNVCDDIRDHEGVPEFVCSHAFDMTAAERSVADALARRVGWV